MCNRTVVSYDEGSSMGFGKFLGKAAGSLAGKVVRLGTDFTADVTGSTFIREVGEAAEKASTRTGELVGQAADGAGGAARGAWTGDEQMTKEGLREAGSAVTDTVVGVAVGVGTVLVEGETVVKSLKAGDTKGAGAAARNIAKVAAVSVLAVGALDMLDVIDIGADGPDDSLASAESGAGEDTVATEGPGTHFVEPHDVAGHVRSDGIEVSSYWRDGDGDTSIDRDVEHGGGYIRSNPDGDPSNNLRSS